MASSCSLGRLALAELMGTWDEQGGGGALVPGHAGLQAERCARGGDFFLFFGGGGVSSGLREGEVLLGGEVGGDTISFSTVLEKNDEKFKNPKNNTKHSRQIAQTAAKETDLRAV